MVGTASMKVSEIGPHRSRLFRIGKDGRRIAVRNQKKVSLAYKLEPMSSRYKNKYSMYRKPASRDGRASVKYVIKRGTRKLINVPGVLNFASSGGVVKDIERVMLKLAEKSPKKFIAPFYGHLKKGQKGRPTSRGLALDLEFKSKMFAPKIRAKGPNKGKYDISRGDAYKIRYKDKYGVSRVGYL